MVLDLQLLYASKVICHKAGTFNVCKCQMAQRPCSLQVNGYKSLLAKVLRKIATIGTLIDYSVDIKVKGSQLHYIFSFFNFFQFLKFIICYLLDDSMFYYLINLLIIGASFRQFPRQQGPISHHICLPFPPLSECKCYLLAQRPLLAECCSILWLNL